MTDKNDNLKEIGVPVIGISRHRIGTDGHGVTTLVAFYGCELRCKLCLNPQCFAPNAKVKYYTPERLFEEVVKDDLYFQATGGGITFGGGEPGLQTDFICRFKELCPDRWKIRLETSLNFPSENIQKLTKVVDEWIVDIKTTDPEAYIKYTGLYRTCSQINLDYLSNLVYGDKIIIRIPIIPGYVNDKKAEVARKRLEKQGFSRFDIFNYTTEDEHREHVSSTETGLPLGKRIWETLKNIRHEAAESRGIAVRERECTHKGNCPGTCPTCEEELAQITKGIGNRHIWKQRAWFTERDYNNVDSDPSIDDPDMGIDTRTQGMPELPPGEDMGDIKPRNVIEPGMLGGVIVDPPDRTFLKECAVAGVSFHVKYDDELWDELEEGQEVALVRDRNNKYDKNAVAVALADDFDGDVENFDFDFIIGYLPRTENEDIAAMLDEGQDLYAELTTVKRHGNINDRLRVSTYLEESDDDKPSPLLRAMSMDEKELSSFENQLNELGFAHFRWGGFPLSERNIPKKGERIVIIHKRKEDILLYLTFVLAKGTEECSAITSDGDILREKLDDCVPYIITNICGPISIKPGPFGFLLSDSLANLSVFDYLSADVSDGFKSIFKHNKP